MRSELPTGTVTFLFTDVEGSTKLLHALGTEAYADALAEHRRVIRAACTVEGGVEVDTQGDAFFFAFPTATGAVAAASAFTGSLASTRIQVRVGLHTGMPLVTEEGYIGDDVHLAARVAATGHGGQVVLSRTTAGLLEDSAEDSAEVRELGEHRLKDISDPVALYQLGDDSFPPLRTISNTNLPRPASSFLGRDAELAQVLDRLGRGARLVTLTGPGGTGKTRLAIEAAATLVPEYSAGVFWVGLATLRDPALVTESIAQTLGAQEELAQHIGQRQMLLLLDNMEQVIGAAPDLAPLLERCPNLTLLVTSRELLRISGEVGYDVPPLAAPDAVRLFCERAQLEPTPQIAELCARLDSLPLAVELAAARTKALTPAQILDRLSGRLDMLAGGRDADPRQQTLKATIEWSYDLLTDAEALLFARLAIFAGGCTLEAAEAVADADLDTVQSLIEKSLLRFTDSRYWMLETIREFATQTLGDTSGPMADRHAEYFLATAEALAPDLRRDEQARALELVAADIDNHRAALRHLSEKDDPAKALRLAVALSDYWWLRGRTAEGVAWSRAALAAHPERTPRRAEGLRTLSELLLSMGSHDRGPVVESISVSRELGETALLARCLNNLGVLEIFVEDLDAAAVALDESVTIRRALGDSVGLNRTLGNLANLELKRDNLDRAEALYLESLSLDAYPFDHAIDRVGLGEISLRRGELDAAARAFSLALDHALEVRSAPFLSDLLINFGRVWLGRGDATLGCVLLGAASRLDEEVDPFENEEQLFTEKAELLAGLRASLDEAAFDAAYAQGRALTLEEAVELAVA